MHHIFYLTGSEIIGGIASVVVAGSVIAGKLAKKKRTPKASEHMTARTKVNVRNAEALRKLREAMDKYKRYKDG